MGKGTGFLLMILGAVVFLWGTTIVAQSPYFPLEGNSIQLIAVIVFVIGAVVVYFSGPKPRPY